jgi:fatty aldehyde-generating acyl-ACP reductase
MAGNGPWFAFIVHPRDLPELIAMPGASLVYDHSEDDEEFIAKALGNPPVVLADVVFSGSAVRGELIGIGRLPDTMLSTDAHRAVADAVDLAVGRGAPVVGLGALTAPATAGGRALLRRLPRGVTLTNGNGLTAAVIRRNVREAGLRLDLDRRPRVALLGATGSVGAALARLLGEDELELTLIGASLGRIERTLGDLLAAGHGSASTLDALADADVVVVLTNASSARVTPGDVRPGAIVIDVAQPPNVSASDAATFAAEGVAVVPGGVVRIPGYSCRQDFGLPSPRDTFACLAETYLLAREGLRDHSTGTPSTDYALRIERVAERHGVTPLPLFGELGEERVGERPLSGKAT